MTTTPASLTVASDDFTDGATVPDTMVAGIMGFTGGNTSPHLHWSSVPTGTKSIVVTMYDPDAPTTVGFTHWILYDLDPKLTQLDAGAGKHHHNPHGSHHAMNDMGLNEYLGPCPPPGPAHRYIITVWALDLPKLEGAGDKCTYPKLRFMMRDHILASGSITGLFGVAA